MTLVPVIGAFITGFGLEDLSTFFEEGLGSVMKVVVMFIFAIIFFGILQDVGLFTPIIRTLIKTTRGNVVAVAVGTGLIGVVAHLDGSGSTTFLLTIPALLPLYQALHMSRYVSFRDEHGALGRAAGARGCGDLTRHEHRVDAPDPDAGSGVVVRGGDRFCAGCARKAPD